MAFAFVVEDGTGLTTATSYVTVAYADDYFAPTASAEAWDALTTEQKEFLLAWASRFLDQKAEWKGKIASEDQALRWPRTGVYTRDKIAIGGSVIPKQLKDAVSETAKFLIENDPTAGQNTDQFKKLVVDVIEIEYQDQTSQTNFPSIINSILAGLGYISIGPRQASKILRS